MNTLKTLNLDLLPIELNDLDDLFKLKSNKDVVKYVEKQADKSLEETKQFIKKLQFQLSSTDNDYVIYELTNTT